MTDEGAEIRRANRRDRKAVSVGVAVTALCTISLFVLPDLLPVETIRSWLFRRTGRMIGGPASNPFSPVRIAGGVVGSACAGWLTSERGYGAVTGAKAALYGLAVATVAVMGVLLVYWTAVLETVPPPMFDIVFIPLGYAAFLFPIYLVSGLVVGAAASAVRTRLLPAVAPPSLRGR